MPEWFPFVARANQQMAVVPNSSTCHNPEGQPVRILGQLCLAQQQRVVEAFLTRGALTINPGPQLLRSAPGAPETIIYHHHEGFNDCWRQGRPKLGGAQATVLVAVPPHLAQGQTLLRFKAPGGPASPDSELVTQAQVS